MPSIHFWKSGNQSNTLHSPSNILHVTFHIQYSMYPVQNSTYPTQNSTYPIQNSTYAIQNSTYPIQNSTYTATHLGGPAALPSQPVQGHESIQLRTSGTAPVHDGVQAKPSGASTISLVGCSFKGKRASDSPLCGDQGQDEGKESVGCLDRVQQTKGYTVQKTTAQLETVDSEDAIQQAPHGRNKVLKCLSGDPVW